MQESHRFIGPVGRHEKMIVMERRNGIHADTGVGQSRRDGRQKAYRIERGVNRQRDQARGKRVA